MSTYPPHPLVVAVAGGVVENGAHRTDAELFAATWQSFAPRLAIGDEMAALVQDLAKADAAGRLAGVAKGKADDEARTLVTELQNAISADRARVIPIKLLKKLEKPMAEIGKASAKGDEDDITESLRDVVGDVVASWGGAAAARRGDPEVIANARRLTNRYISDADASEVLIASGYLGGFTSDDHRNQWQALYLEPTMQASLLIRTDGIVTMARVPDDKQPFGCKPDAVWIKTYTPAIHSDVKLTKEVIAARLHSRDFTTAAVAIDALTGGNAAPFRTFGEEILGVGYTTYGPPWCPVGGGRKP
jgi:hypothetical protein